MWLITNDWCGLACAIFTYLIVAIVYWGFIRIGIWENMLKGEIIVFIHYIIFQFNCIMIFWSHWKCMTSDPGSLPKQKHINYKLLPNHFKDIIEKIGTRMISLEKRIERDDKAKNIKIEILDKSELRILSTGAEDTTDSSDEDEDYND